MCLCLYRHTYSGRPLLSEHLAESLPVEVKAEGCGRIEMRVAREVGAE